MDPLNKQPANAVPMETAPPHTDPFLAGYLNKLESVECSNDITRLYDWSWENSESIGRAVQHLNRVHKLTKDFRLRNVHPIQFVGRMNQDSVVLLAANPGFRKKCKIQEEEERICRQSRESYSGLYQNYFERYPERMQVYPQWWEHAIRSITGIVLELTDHHPSLLNFSETRCSNFIAMRDAKEREKRWAIAGQELALMELIPFHSSRDKLTKTLTRPGVTDSWARNCSNSAIDVLLLKLRPKLVVAASAASYSLVHERFIDNKRERWGLSTIPGPKGKPVNVALGRVEDTILVVVAWQFYTRPPCKRSVLHEGILNAAKSFLDANSIDSA